MAGLAAPWKPFHTSHVPPVTGSAPKRFPVHAFTFPAADGQPPRDPGQQSGHLITDRLSEPLVSHWKGEAHHPASWDTSCECCGERSRLKVRRYKEHQPGDTKTSFNLSKSHIELHKEFPREPPGGPAAEPA